MATPMNWRRFDIKYYLRRYCRMAFWFPKSPINKNELYFRNLAPIIIRPSQISISKLVLLKSRKFRRVHENLRLPSVWQIGFSCNERCSVAGSLIHSSDGHVKALCGRNMYDIYDYKYSISLKSTFCLFCIWHSFN